MDAIQLLSEAVGVDHSEVLGVVYAGNLELSVKYFHLSQGVEGTQVKYGYAFIYEWPQGFF